MSQAYYPLLQFTQGCKCGAHRLHRVFRYAWENPSASRKDCARSLKLSYNNVLEAFYQLRRRDLTRLCPECFNATVLDGACHTCGFEPTRPVLPIEVMANSQSPTNNLHPGNELGSEVDYSELGLVNRGFVLNRKIERGMEDPLIRAVKSDVENELKRSYPSEIVSDEAGRLAIKEVREFRVRYPSLANSKKVREQLAENVMRRITFLHPQLRRISQLAREKTQ